MRSKTLRTVTCVDPRHSIRLRVELTGSDSDGNRFKQTAFTHDVSLHGARITQAPPLLYPAAVVEVKYRGRRSRFRVVWVGGFATNEIGLLSLEPTRCIWGYPLPGQLIRSAPPIAAALPSAVKSQPTVWEDLSSGSDDTDQFQQTRTRVGYFCKHSACRKRRVFHRIPDNTIVWDIWPQKFECPISGYRYEYSKGEVRNAEYA
jgi:hypothetical protein